MASEDPRTIGRYKVLSRLGAGAMGAVYLCQDPLLKRRVAVKIVLRTRADSEAMMERFQRESEISAQLNHPHIITVFDVGLDEEVGPFLTMEFVDGGSLASHLERGQPDPATALDWLTQLGQALVAAERAGVVHRDIKPENMLVSGDGQIKLTDFGLARDDVSSLTTTGTMMGTPTHTAPELLGGARATPATDRWAFAVTAFQMVLGRLPHSGDTLSAVLHHIDREPPAIPEGTPAPLTRLFLKALHRDPARRHPSVLAFLTALADALGLRERLVTRGLDPGPAAAVSGSSPAIGETENFPLPRVAAAPAEPGRGASPAPVPRLTKPPAELFAAPEPPGPDAEAPAQARASGPPAPARTSASRAAGGRVSSSRIQIRPVQAPSGGWLGHAALAAAVAAALGGFWFWPRPMKVQTSPPGATVLLDGRTVGVTPFEGTTTFGSHQLVVSKPGYDPVSLAVRAGEGPVDLVLAPFTAWMDVVTVPSGATVTLGDRALGSSPRLGLPVPDRPEPLVVQLKGYRRWRSTVGPGRRPPNPIVLVRESS